MKRLLAFVALATPMLASAVANSNITTGITTAQTAFTDNWGAVFSFYVGIVVVLVAGGMLVKYIRRAR